MPITLDLNDDLLAEAKTLAARERLTHARLIEEGLALRLRLPVHARRGGLAVAMTPDVTVLVSTNILQPVTHPRMRGFACDGSRPGGDRYAGALTSLTSAGSRALS